MLCAYVFVYVCLLCVCVCVYCVVCMYVWCYVHYSIRLEVQLLQEKKAANTREAELVKEGVAKDAQILALQEAVSTLRSHLRSRDADVEKCVKALSKQIIFYLKPLLQV